MKAPLMRVLAGLGLLLTACSGQDSASTAPPGSPQPGTTPAPTSTPPLSDDLGPVLRVFFSHLEGMWHGTGTINPGGKHSVIDFQVAETGTDKWNLTGGETV